MPPTSAPPSNNSWLRLLPGLGLTLGVAFLALLLGNLPWSARFGISTLTLAIVLGMILGNTVNPAASTIFQEGVTFSKGPLLRTGIILYGFHLTWQQLLGVGGQGLIGAGLMLVSTFLLAQALGRLLRVDPQTTALIGAGSSICGAAAVLATEPTVRARPGQVAVAMATVVLFGTIAIFLYPAMNALHLWPFAGQTFGIYIGSSVHEVAQVVAAGKAISPEVADAAVTTKLIRVMLLGPFLLLLALWWQRTSLSTSTTRADASAQRGPIPIPWFAFGFVAVSLLNSLHVIPTSLVGSLLTLDTLLLSMAMAALGLTTRFATLKQAGVRPLLLGGLLMVWLVVGGGLLEVLLTTLHL